MIVYKEVSAEGLVRVAQALGFPAEMAEPLREALAEEGNYGVRIHTPLANLLWTPPSYLAIGSDPYTERQLLTYLDFLIGEEGEYIETEEE